MREERRRKRKEERQERKEEEKNKGKRKGGRKKRKRKEAIWRKEGREKKMFALKPSLVCPGIRSRSTA